MNRLATFLIILAILSILIDAHMKVVGSCSGILSFNHTTKKWENTGSCSSG